MHNESLIRLTDVDQSFLVGRDTIHVLHGVDFAIRHGTFNIIYGASGSGKSTLLNILTGLQRPTRGTVKYNGLDIYGLSSDKLARFRAERIGVVYQQNYWVGSLSVLENVCLPLYFMGYSRSTAKKMAISALERVHMEGYINKVPAFLSGGEQQRINMARALSTDPYIVIADEPTGNLDSKNGDMVMGMLDEANRTIGLTIILVTHNMEYLPLADNLLHIQDGVVSELNHGTVLSTTNALMKEMKDRITRLSEQKKLKAVGEA